MPRLTPARAAGRPPPWINAARAEGESSLSGRSVVKFHLDSSSFHFYSAEEHPKTHTCDHVSGNLYISLHLILDATSKKKPTTNKQTKQKTTKHSLPHMKCSLFITFLYKRGHSPLICTLMLGQLTFWSSVQALNFTKTCLETFKHKQNYVSIWCLYSCLRSWQYSPFHPGRQAICPSGLQV